MMKMLVCYIWLEKEMVILDIMNSKMVNLLIYHNFNLLLLVHYTDFIQKNVLMSKVVNYKEL